ncbi:MAG: hypothetical protein GTO08_09865, partial [Deltaproteobacteria bacterium]|nr:hypothetical protein [Deltaproteobacteria bacterium]
SLAKEASDVISKKDPAMLGAVIERDWHVRKSLSPQVTFDRFENFLKKKDVRKMIYSARLCGAGGGGTMFAVLKGPEHRKSAEAAAEKAGFSPLPFSISRGLEVRIGGKRVQLL